MKALVIGGGIGGLATALSLDAAGIECCVCESVARIDALGLGINLQPNAVRELIELGLGDALAETAIETSTLAYYNKHGQLIWSEPRGLAAGYRWPQYSIHRGELLHAAARGGARPCRHGQYPHGASLRRLRSGCGRRHRAFRRAAPAVGSCRRSRADVLIGADGIHSAVRAPSSIRDEAQPVPSGGMQWRGAIETAPYLDGRTQAMIGHFRQRTIIYPMSAQGGRARPLARQLARLPATAPSIAQRESWDRKVPKERFLAAFKDWNFDWIAAADLDRGDGGHLRISRDGP